MPASFIKLSHKNHSDEGQRKEKKKESQKHSHTNTCQNVHKKHTKHVSKRAPAHVCQNVHQNTCQNAHQYTCVKTCTKTRAKTRTKQVSKRATKTRVKASTKTRAKTRVKTCNNQRSATLRIKGHTSELLLKKLTQLCYLLNENTQMFGLVAGRQKRALKPLQPTGLAVNLTTLPQQLGKLGYQTHMVGKWHLGKTACTPEVPR